MLLLKDRIIELYYFVFGGTSGFSHKTSKFFYKDNFVNQNKEEGMPQLFL